MGAQARDRGRRRGLHARLRAVLALLVAVLVATSTQPALAHPLGPPPEVTLEASGEEVLMTWRAERDDLYAIALSVGAVAGELIFEEVNGEVVQVGGERDDEILAESEEIARYLTEQLAVSQAGVACEAALDRRPTYEGQAAELVFTCPELVGVVEVTISALTEFSDAYRTIVRATDADPSRGLHTAADPTARYAFDAAEVAGAGSEPGSSGASRAAAVVTAALALLALGAAVLLWRARTAWGRR